MTVGMARVTVVQEISPGADSKTGDFVEEVLGGATVERLVYLMYDVRCLPVFYGADVW